MSDSLRFKDLIPMPMTSRSLLLRKKTGETIPSFHRLATPPAEFQR